MRLLLSMCVFVASVSTPVAAQFQSTSVTLPGLSQVIGLSLNEANDLHFAAREADQVLFERTFGYTPYADVSLLSRLPGHELVRLSMGVDVFLYDPNGPALSPRLPWPGERDFADPTDHLVNGVDISTDGTRLRVGHLVGMGSVYFFYDITHPLSAIFLEQSKLMTWDEIGTNGKPSLTGYHFVQVLTADLYKPGVPSRE